MPDTVISVGGDITDLQKKLGQSEREIDGLKSRLSKKSSSGGVGEVLGDVKGFLGGVVGITALKGLVDEFDRLGDLSTGLGYTAESLQRVGRMAKQSGTDVEPVVAALTKLRKNIEAGGDDKTSEALAEIGINAQQLLSLAPDQQIASLAEAFQTAQAKGIGFNAMQTLMGKGFADMLPLLRTSRAELEALASGPVVSEAAIIRIQALNDGLDEMAETAKTAGAELLDALGTRLQAGIQSALQGGSVGDNLKKIQDEGKAAADAKKKQSEEQRKQDAAAAEASKKQAAADEGAKIQIENEKKKAEIAFEGLTTAQKLEEVQRRIADINSRAEGLRGKDDPVAAAKLEGELIDQLKIETALKEKAADEREREAQAAKRTAEAAARDAKAAQEKVQRQVDAQRNLGDELAILEARAHGRERLAKQLEKEARIKAEAAKIEKDTGLDPKQARAIAEKKEELTDRAEKRSKGKIIGGKSKLPLSLEENLEALRNKQIKAQTPTLDDFQAGNKRDASGKLIKPVGGQGKQLTRQAQEKQDANTRAANQADGARTTEELLRALVKNTESLRDLDS